MLLRKSTLASVKVLAIFFVFFLLSEATCACVYPCHSFNHSFLYAGVSLNYAKTTWSELCSQDTIVEVSTPYATQDEGISWGGVVGYEFSNLFAIEANYTRYPDTIIYIDSFSFYYPVTQFTSHTEAASLIGKIILPLINDRIDAFLDAGIGVIRRRDPIANVIRATPTFGLGFKSNVSRHFITSVGFEYYMGYGKSERMPVNDFVPFLVALYVRLAYRF